jgi:hypothetical protein
MSESVLNQRLMNFVTERTLADTQVCPYNEIFDVGANLCVRPGCEIIFLNLYI